ncbi:MAG: hypothetical protein JW982_00455 [Spirochaetes bacterium]|nr:hypothetical protein [Spirochaetota bacterium]
MKFNAKLLFLLFLFLAVSAGCDFSKPDSDTPEDMFYVISDDGQYLTLRHFAKIITGTNCTVWQDDYIAMTEATAQSIADEFDSLIYGKVTSNFALPYDVDGDGHVAIFVYSGDNGSSGSYIAGYFYPRDMYNQSGSNKMDVIYLNGSPGNHLPGSQNFYGTIAHEFQHMCNFSWNVINEHNGDSNYQMVTWADEGMAEASNALCYGFASNQDRVSYFDDSYNNTTFKNGDISLILWESDVNNYALVYSFMAFLYKQSNNIFHNFYNGGTDNDTSEIDFILSNNGLSGLNSQYTAFLPALYQGNSTSTLFPTGFFPSGFSIEKSGNSNIAIKPYAFVFRSTPFTSDNSDITYLDSSGGTAAYNTAEIATWINNTAWSYETASSWSSQQNTNSAYVANIANYSLFSVSMNSAPRKIDLVFPKGGNEPVILENSGLEDSK